MTALFLYIAGRRGDTSMGKKGKEKGSPAAATGSSSTGQAPAATGGSGKGKGGGKAAKRGGGGGFPNVLVTPTDLQEAILSASGELVVLDFTAPWCSVCTKINPFLAKLSAELSAGWVRFTVTRTVLYSFDCIF